MRDYRDEDHMEEYRRQAVDDREFLEDREFRYRNPCRCETCAWYRYSELDDEWVCVNRHSQFCAELVGDYDYCGEWERKKDDDE